VHGQLKAKMLHGSLLANDNDQPDFTVRVRIATVAVRPVYGHALP